MRTIIIEKDIRKRLCHAISGCAQMTSQNRDPYRESGKHGPFKVTRPSFFGGLPSYFEALWYPHLYFYRKSNT